MSLFNVTNTHPVTLTLAHTVGEALQLMLQHRLESMPVLDEKQRLAGRFGVHELLGLLLPKAATLELGLSDISFIANTAEHLRTHLQQISDHRVGDHLAEAVTLRPTTSLPEALLLLYRHGNELPVVEASGQFVGMVSPWEILAALAAPGDHQDA
jgi:CBS-domain-containing membrane protein